MRFITLVGLSMVCATVLPSACVHENVRQDEGKIFTVYEVIKYSSDLDEKTVAVCGILKLEWESDRLIGTGVKKDSEDYEGVFGRSLSLEISGFPDLRGQAQIDEYWSNRDKWDHMNDRCVLVIGKLRTKLSSQLISDPQIGMSHVSTIQLFEIERCIRTER